MLVGRSAERRRIGSLLAAARAGTSGLLVLQGEAGIGKTALVDDARHRARGMTRLAMRGVESEARLAFAGLTELLRPCAEALAALPAPQADALHGALAVHAEPANPLTVRVALLTLLASLADEAPVLVTVDDAQWVDDASLQILAFAVRRLVAERVAVVVAVRGELPAALAAVAAAAEDWIVLEGLSDDEARRLVADRACPGGRALDDLVRVAAGNPLALLELPVAAGASGTAGVGGPAGLDPPAVGPRVQQAFRTRLDRLPPATRLAIGVVAADSTVRVGDILRALAALDLGADVLQPAEDEGLVQVTAEHVELRHPLLRPVAYHALSAPDRRRAHAALATALARPGEVERRTWHRAAAAVGPDNEVAVALEGVARTAERRGDLVTTAHGFARAADLSVSDEGRARRLLASSEAWLAAGHWEPALDRLEQAARHVVEPRLRADVLTLTGQLEVYRSGPEKGAEILVATADAIEDADPGRATLALTYAVNVAVLAGDIHTAVALADRAAACGDRAGGLHQTSGAMARLQAGLLAGDPAVPAAREPFAQLALARHLIESDLGDAEHVFSLVVLADFVLESWARAEELLDLMVERSHTTGRTFLLAFALVVKGELDFRRGRWADAYTTITTRAGDEPSGLPGLPGVSAWTQAVQARIEAGLGLVDEASQHGQAALAGASATGMRAMAAWARASLGFLELGRDRPRAARDHLEQVAADLDGGGLAEPGILWWAPDLIEAHWRLGDLGAARRRTEILAGQAAATGRTWASAVASRSSGLLASTPAEAEAAFASALTWHDRLDAPFERARTLLRQGERRLELGHDDPAPPLREALATFERLGARLWTTQARRLLGDEQAPAPPLPLTRQERQVATIVGRGATNREAADQLFLSVRTIDFHLRNIYRKLQVRSRTELAVRLATTPDPDPG